jgi:Arc/MetJ-type ribon-helix-helix transcriptional regulator
MELILRPEAQARIERELQSGRFADADELIATAMNVLSDTTPADLTDLNGRIQEGIDSAERGELYSEDEVRAYIAAVRAKL